MDKISEFNFGLVTVDEDRYPNLQVVELEVGDVEEVKGDELFKGKPFEGVAAGKFRPGNFGGRMITIKESDLPEIVKNTKVAIESTKQSDGEVWGLPIDAVDHIEMSGAAGWITDIYMDNGKVYLVPNWTALGVETIKAGKFKFFSGTIDLNKKILHGGTLTNWPATRDEDTGEILLAPIELSSEDRIAIIKGIELSDDDGSYSDKDRAARSAFYNHQLGVDGPDTNLDEAYVEEVFDDHLIVDVGGVMFKVEYSIDKDGNFEFADPDEWTRVKNQWVEATSPKGRSLKEVIQGWWTEFNKDQAAEEDHDDEPDLDPPAIEQQKISEVSVMSKFTKEQLATFEALLPRVDGESDESYEGRVAQLAEFGGSITGDLNDQSVEDVANKHTEAQIAAFRAQEKKRFDRLMAEMNHEREVDEFVLSMTGGTQEDPKFVGLPVDRAELTTIMKKFDTDTFEVVSGLLSQIQEKGLREFDERGVNMGGVVKELPAAYVSALKMHLESGNTVASFKASLDPANDEGDKQVVENWEKYDLSEFEALEKQPVA